VAPATLPSSTLATDDKYSLLSASQRYLAIFSLFCAFEFATMSIAELLVLHRYLVFAFKSLSPTPEQLATSRFLFVAGCVVVAFNISNIVAGCTVMYYRTQTSRSLSNAAAAYGLDPAADYESTWYSSSRNADIAAAAQNMFEVLSLFIKAAAFAFIGRLDLKRLEQAKQLLPVRAWCTCRAVVVIVMRAFFRSTFPSLPPSQSNDDISPDFLPELRRKLVNTTAFILSALVLRLAFALFEATGQIYIAPHANASPLNAMLNCELCNSTCSSSSAVTSIFLTFTPELRLSSNLVSVPLALLVALW